MFKVTGSRSKVEPGSDHDVAQLDHDRNMCAKFELLLAYSHRDLARTKLQPMKDENNTRTAMNGCGVKTRCNL